MQASVAGSGPPQSSEIIAMAPLRSLGLSLMKRARAFLMSAGLPVSQASLSAMAVGSVGAFDEDEGLGHLAHGLAVDCAVVHGSVPDPGAVGVLNEGRLARIGRRCRRCKGGQPGFACY